LTDRRKGRDFFPFIARIAMARLERSETWLFFSYRLINAISQSNVFVSGLTF